jgi:hypothetical protein
MLEKDATLRRVLFWGEVLRFPVFASLGVILVGVILTIALDLSWLYLVIGGALAWFLFARLAIQCWRRVHLDNLQWRLDHGTQRERTLLTLAQRATWNWPEEVPDDATHAVVVLEEVGGELEVEKFDDFDGAKKLVETPHDLLAGDREPVIVGLVELDSPPESALIEVRGHTIGKRRSLTELDVAEDGWLVGI